MGYFSGHKLSLINISTVLFLELPQDLYCERNFSGNFFTNENNPL